MTYQKGQNIVCFHVRRIMENATRWRRQEKACKLYNQFESHSLFSTLSSFTLSFLKSWPLLLPRGQVGRKQTLMHTKNQAKLSLVYMCCTKLTNKEENLRRQRNVKVS